MRKMVEYEEERKDEGVRQKGLWLLEEGEKSEEW